MTTYDRAKLVRNIHTIGMGTLIEYYEYFADNKYSRRYIENKMMREQSYKPTSVAAKTSAGIAIVRTNALGKEALKIVEQAEKIPEETRQKAHLLLEKMQKQQS